eukprot:549764_1
MPMVVCQPVFVQPYDSKDDLRSLPRGITTLLVDDDSLNRTMLGHIIQKSMKSWECKEAATGEETITMVKRRKHRFHVIRLDENMETAGGALKGSDTANMIRAMERYTNELGVGDLIIGFSGNCLNEDREY